jgi:hypothetical protein
MVAILSSHSLKIPEIIKRIKTQKIFLQKLKKVLDNPNLIHYIIIKEVESRTIKGQGDMTMTKKIFIVSPDSRKSEKGYPSYAAIARELAVGEAVTVSVTQGKGRLRVNMGFGEVKRTGKDSFSSPGRLAPDI